MKLSFKITVALLFCLGAYIIGKAFVGISEHDKKDHETIKTLLEENIQLLTENDSLKQQLKLK